MIFTVSIFDLSPFSEVGLPIPLSTSFSEDIAASSRFCSLILAVQLSKTGDDKSRYAYFVQGIGGFYVDVKKMSENRGGAGRGDRSL